MNNLVRQKLCEIITQYGKDVYEKPQRGAGLLLDLCAQYRKKTAVLIGALKDGVPARLQHSKNSVSHVILLSQLSKGLEDNLGLSEEGAIWAVESWAVALGIISVDNLSTSKTKLSYSDDYDQAIKLNPNHADAYYSRGYVNYNLGYQEEAIADFDQAIKLNPNLVQGGFYKW